jgi:hypothetical protein
VDDMLETFRDAQKNRLDKDRYYNPLKSEFNSFEFDVVSKAGMETFMSERYKNLNKKIEDFGEMHFNKKYNKDEYRRSSSGRSEYKREDYQRSYDSFFTTKQTEAKNKILEVLNKDKNEKELLDLANELNSKKLDEALINKIRKKIAFKYHTDKAPQDKYNEYLQIMQEANNALDILKKTL